MKISKRAVVITAAAVVALGTGGAIWATTASADVQGGERERVANAATQAVPGTVQDVETSDDPGEAYEVEVRKDDGSEVDVALDKDLKVVGQDNSDRVLTAAERASAEQAALAAVGGGTVTAVEGGDDGSAYEVDVHDAAGAEWDVDLDAGFTVLSKTADD
ncbi:Peptidase propeptide and YPEB domain-containing protein [Asanoa hainanensis]|uniref:Peptidase propeptide and YPEB domain-containing protein n=1 Tax=Asanoa hainanensis TaxID=560556 RepID=A0A239P0I9_9ACTN|nr:PepSY domain-containing protein [Asanoa hainanensis]SNT60615.1 Peptidase propeptide and YPEB domain-containing protein [Asanoa hainanensis]